MGFKSIAVAEAKSVLYLPNGGAVSIEHYGHSVPNPLGTLGVDGLIIEGMWGFNDLGGFFGREIVELLGSSEVTIRNTCFEQIEKSRRITVVALRSTNSASTLKSVAFVPTEAFGCCEKFRDTKYGLPCKDFYYNITYEALELLVGHGCSCIAIANLTGYNYYHKNIGNCVTEAVAHFAIENPMLQSIFSIGRGPDLTYGVTFFNEHPDLIGRHRPAAREVHVGAESSFTTITLPRQESDRSGEMAHEGDVASNSTRKAADGGDAHAQCLLGDEYSAVGDKWESMKWYRKSADQGHPYAQFRLGLSYEDRDSMKDAAEALKWFHKAAENGQIDAQFSLGLIYAGGVQVPEDLAKAVKWFRMAANQGDTNAQNELGKMYEEGLGVTQNLVQALKWFSLSALSRDPPAIVDRDSVARHMTPEQIEEAQALVRKWKRK